MNIEAKGPQSLLASWAMSSSLCRNSKVLFALSANADPDTGIVSISHTQVAALTGIPRKRVSENIKKLESAGLIERLSIGRPNPTGGGVSSVYRVGLGGRHG